MGHLRKHPSLDRQRGHAAVHGQRGHASLDGQRVDAADLREFNAAQQHFAQQRVRRRQQWLKHPQLQQPRRLQPFELQRRTQRGRRSWRRERPLNNVDAGKRDVLNT